MQFCETGFAKVAIVDCGLGNLYSVKQACAQVGLHANITSSKQEILAANAVILPGVGAFGDAMTALRTLDLVSVLRDVAASPRILVGICLGLQLLMTESYEFGRHEGLGVVEGSVVHFGKPREDQRLLKVPQIGWNRIYKNAADQANYSDPWANSFLDGLVDGEHMYFVHSYIVQPQDPDVIISTSCYGDVEFCSSLKHRNVFACQFHPERSGPLGLKVYRNLVLHIQRAIEGEIL
jgi:glutamine amidotransferase|tara:strand:+ start:8819 stop:9526 length:708 start_codon:yes stop_codon:yes gene_type:complete